MRPWKFWHSLNHTSIFGGRVLLTMATNVTLALFGLLTGILAARLLGPHGRGELAAIQLWPSIIVVVAMLGLPDSLVYYAARSPERVGRFMSTAMALALLMSVPVVLLGYELLPMLLAAQSEDVIKAARWYLLLVPIYVLVVMPQQPLRGRNDFVAWNALRMMPPIAWLGVLLVAWFLGGADAERIACSYLVALALLFFPVAYVVSGRVPGPFRTDMSGLFPLLRFGFPSMASNVPQMVNIRLAHMLIAALLPPQMLGLYAVAVAWSGAAHPLVGALGTVMFSSVASQATAARQHNIFAQTSRLSVVVALATAGVLLPLTPFVLPLLFGEYFHGAIPTALILVVAGSVSSVNMVLEEGMRGLGAPTAVLKVELCGLVVTGSVIAALLQPFGIEGAALGCLLGQTTVLGILVLLGRRMTGNSIKTLLCSPRAEIRYASERVQAIFRAVQTVKDDAH